MPITELQGATFNERMREAREKAGLTLQDVVYEMRRLLPEPMQGSVEKVRRLETNATESNCDIHLVEFLCRLYGLKVEVVSGRVAAALTAYRELLDSDRIDLRDRGVEASGCSSGMGRTLYPDGDFFDDSWATPDIELTDSGTDLVTVPQLARAS